jgi:hypothetical protein
VREAKCRRRARHRRTGSYLLIIDGTTETHRTLDDVENALFPPTEVMPTGLPRGWLHRERDGR